MAVQIKQENDVFLAQPPSACCYTGGSLHAGTPAGSVEPVADIPTYVTRPPEGVAANGHVILYFPDVWGLSHNARLLMDGFAAAGFVAFGIDYFRGDDISRYRSSHDGPLPPDFDLAAWRSKHFTFATENVPRWVAAVKATVQATVQATAAKISKSTHYGCVGYCFGAPFVTTLLADESGSGGSGVSAGAFAHPTMLREADFQGIKKPLFLSCAEHDHAFPTESRRKAIDILQESKIPYHLQLFSHVKHGFAARGNLSDPYELWAKEQSHRGITDWFSFWLSRE